MQLNWPVIATIGLVLLGGGVIFLAQAVEPTRETAVEVLDSERFARELCFCVFCIADTRFGGTGRDAGTLKHYSRSGAHAIWHVAAKIRY